MVFGRGDWGGGVVLTDWLVGVWALFFVMDDEGVVTVLLMFYGVEFFRL